MSLTNGLLKQKMQHSLEEYNRIWNFHNQVFILSNIRSKISQYTKLVLKIDAFSRMETDSDMILMFGLADRNLKTAIITMPSDIKESMFTMNKNMEILKQRNRNGKKESSGKYVTKK